jgi:predicted SprT family Zn-dependent metalloprotease
VTQILTPFADRIRNKNQEGIDARRAGMHKRMCWTCQIEKPLKGGVFPGRVSNKTTPVERFRCADCTARLVAKNSDQKIE